MISDSSLNDIKYVLNPIFTPEQIDQMDSNTKKSRAIDGTMYMPGIVGLNNIKANDYCNVILQVCFNFQNVDSEIQLDTLPVIKSKPTRLSRAMTSWHRLLTLAHLFWLVCTLSHSELTYWHSLL